MNNDYHLRRFIPTLIFTTMLGSLLAGCGTKSNIQATALQPLPVSVQTVARSPVTSQNTYLGQVTPYIQTSVSPAISGVLATVDVRPGQVIAKGQVLATLNTNQLQAQLTQSQANAGVSQTELTSAMESNNHALEQAQASIKTAQANLAQVQTTTQNTIAQNQQTVNTQTQQYQDAVQQFDTSIVAEENALSLAKQQLQSAQTNQQNVIAQAQSQYDTAQANLTAVKKQQSATITTDEANVANLQQELQNANTTLTQAEEMNHLMTAPAILQAQSQYDQSQTALQNAQNALQLEQSSSALQQAEGSFAAAKANLQSAQANQPVAVATAQLNQAQQALTSAKQSKSLSVAAAQLEQAKTALVAAQGSATTSIAASKAQLQQVTTSYDTQVNNPQIQVNQAQIQAANAGVQVLQAQIQDGQILAPISGYVQAVNDQVGQGVGAQSTLVTLASMSPEMVTVNVPEFDINKLHDGTGMTVTVPSLNEVLHGHVLAIHPQLSTSTLAYPVDIEVSGSTAPLLPGLEVQAVESSSVSHLGIMVPADAVLSLQSGANEVFIVSHGVAQAQIVQIGAMTQNEYQITGGLSLGQELVVQGQNLLSPGNQVTLVSLNGKSLISRSHSVAADTKHHSKKKGISS